MRRGAARRVLVVALAVALGLAGAACSDDSPAQSTPTTTAPDGAPATTGPEGSGDDGSGDDGDSLTAEEASAQLTQILEGYRWHSKGPRSATHSTRSSRLA